jgi:hypothetical protein
MGQNLKNGAKLLGGELLQMGKTKWGKIEKMGQKSRIPGLPECHRMSQNVTESCIL